MISKEETLLTKKEINFIDPNNFYLIIPYKFVSSLLLGFIPISNYNLYLLYYDSDKKLKCSHVTFSKAISEKVPTELNLDSIENYYLNIDCYPMENENKNVIACFYGNDDNYIVSTYEILDYNIQLLENKFKVFPVDNVNKRYIFKTRVLPVNQKAVFCSYSQDDNFDCALYDISINSFSNYIHTNIKGSEFHEQNIFIEYFEQSKEILIGKQINRNTLSIIVCTEEFKCSSTIQQTLFCIETYISESV